MIDKRGKLLRILQVLLFLLALDAGIGSLLLLFGNRSVVMRLFPYPPASEVSDLLLLKQKEWGALGIAITIMLVGAVRAPLSQLLVVRALSVGLAIAGIAEVGTLLWLEADRLYPAVIIVAHGTTRVLVAVALAYLVWQLKDGKFKGSLPGMAPN